MKKFYNVLRMSKEDIESEMGKDSAKDLTDEDMRWMASRIGDSLCEDWSYWSCLRESYSAVRQKKASRRTEG